MRGSLAGVGLTLLDLPKILLVNDEEYLLSVYSALLQKHFTVTMAKNGLQALHIVSAFPLDHFSAVILDINMPVMDGYRACRLIYDYLTAKSDRFPSEVPDREQWKRVRP